MVGIGTVVLGERERGGWMLGDRPGLPSSTEKDKRKMRFRNDGNGIGRLYGVHDYRLPLGVKCMQSLVWQVYGS